MALCKPSKNSTLLHILARTKYWNFCHHTAIVKFLREYSCSPQEWWLFSQALNDLFSRHSVSMSHSASLNSCPSEKPVGGSRHVVRGMLVSCHLQTYHLSLCYSSHIKRDILGTADIICTLLTLKVKHLFYAFIAEMRRPICT